MNRFRSLTAGALVAGMLAAGAAFAQGARGTGVGGPGRSAGPAGRGFAAGLPLGSLALTEVQQDLIRDIRTRARDAARQAQTKLRDAHAAQRRAVMTVPPDEGLIRSTAQALADAQIEMALQQARMHTEVLAVLTPEQQEQLRTTVAERESRMQQRRAQLESRRERLRQNRQ